MADRIVVMNGGRIEQIGTPLELYDTPTNLFVADFIGSPSMNVLSGVLGAERGSAYVELPDGTRLAIPDMRSGRVGQEVVFGIRPEHVALEQGGVDEGLGANITVEVVEPTGANIQVYAQLADRPFCAIFTERHQFRPGDRVRLAFPSQKIHLFDAGSGRRL